MTRETDAAAAAERLLDAELATVFGRRAGARPRPQVSWRAAALVLLGVAVVFGTFWLRDGERSAQEPAPVPLPAAVHADTIEALDQLPDDVQNLVCRLEQPRDLARLVRFTKLRRAAVLALDLNVKLFGTKVLGSHRSWTTPPDDCLAPLARMSQLQVLQVPTQMPLRPAMLTPLRQAPALAELLLAGEHQRLDAALVEALSRLPRLRTLRLVRAPVDAEALARLAALPLTTLELSRCPGLDDASFAAVADLVALQTLRLEGLGKAWLGEPPDACWRPSAAALAQLSALPHLRSLMIRDSVVGDDLLRVLPTKLQELEIYSSSGFTTDGLRSLARLGALQRLRFRERSGYGLGEQHRIPPVEAAAALAMLLGKLHLRAIDFTGAATEELLRALAAQADLAEVTLMTAFETEPLPQTDLAPLAAAPALRTLRLMQLAGITDAGLEPLRACRSLRSVELYYCTNCTAEGAQQALPGVAVKFVDAAAAGK